MKLKVFIAAVVMILSVAASLYVSTKAEKKRKSDREAYDLKLQRHFTTLDSLFNLEMKYRRWSNGLVAHCVSLEFKAKDFTCAGNYKKAKQFNDSVGFYLKISDAYQDTVDLMVKYQKENK